MLGRSEKPKIGIMAPVCLRPEFSALFDLIAKKAHPKYDVGMRIVLAGNDPATIADEAIATKPILIVVGIAANADSVSVNALSRFDDYPHMRVVAGAPELPQSLMCRSTFNLPPFEDGAFGPGIDEIVNAIIACAAEHS